MRQLLTRLDDGWATLSKCGRVIRTYPTLSFVADLKHGLALFPGTLEEVTEVVERLRKKARAYNVVDEVNSCICIAQVGEDIDEIEANYMLQTQMLPRRVGMRLRRV